MYCYLKNIFGFALFFLLPLFSGCIILPTHVDTEKKYTDELLLAIQPGLTNRVEVIEILGEPEVALENNSVWLYSTSRVALKLFVAFVFPGTNGAAGAGTDEFYDYQGVVVEFEKEIVVHIEIIEHEASCTSTGICKRTRQEEVYFVSRGELDQKAKEFQAIDDQCSFYIYTPDGWSRFSLDSFRNIEVNSDLYFRVYLQHGSHSFRTFSPSGVFQEEIIECKHGERYFLELSGKGWVAQRNYSVKFVTDDIGRQAISKRKLYLSP
jgi:hypothetical protein